MSDLPADLLKALFESGPLPLGPLGDPRFRTRYTDGHPYFTDSASSGHAYVTKYGDLKYLNSVNVGFVLPHDIIADVQFQADIMTVIVAQRGVSLAVHFDATKIDGKARKKMLKKLRQPN